MTALAPDSIWRRIGASDVSAILGLNPWDSPITVWQRIVEGTKREAGDAAKCGNLLEPVIAYDWADTHGVAIRKGAPVLVPGRDWQRLTVDYETAPASDGASAREAWERAAVDGLEVKTLGAQAMMTHGAQWGASGTDHVPEQHIVQVQAYLEGRSRNPGHRFDAWALAVLIGGQERRDYRIERNIELGEIIVEACERFWRDHVLTGKPPIDGSDRATEYLCNAWRSTTGSLRAATDAEAALAVEYRDAKFACKAAEEHAKVLGNRLREVIGEDDGLTWRSGKVYWKRSKGRPHTDWRQLAERLLDRLTLTAEERAIVLADYTETKLGPRVLRPYIKGLAPEDEEASF